MEIEEKLDYMLTILNQHEGTIKIGIFQTEAEKKVSRSEFGSLYNQLVDDGYAKISTAFEMYIGITSIGRMYLTNGGYQGENKEKIIQRQESKKALAISVEALEVAKESKRISIKNTNWVIFTAILTALSIILSVVFFVLAK